MAWVVFLDQGGFGDLQFKQGRWQVPIGQGGRDDLIEPALAQLRRRDIHRDPRRHGAQYAATSPPLAARRNTHSPSA